MGCYRLVIMLPVHEWVFQQERKLSNYADQIRACLDEGAWENLPPILESRQTYFQELFAESLPVEYREAAKQLIESILIQDGVFQSRIQEQKKLSFNQQLMLERGLRAVQKYTQKSF